jgi:hypothetical protein
MEVDNTETQNPLSDAPKKRKGEHEDSVNSSEESDEERHGTNAAKPKPAKSKTSKSFSAILEQILIKNNRVSAERT